jgi:hypothetical protein
MEGNKMKKFVVTCVLPVYLNIKVEAETEDDAIDEAGQYMYLTNYAGNGGSDKLCGTSESNVSVEGGDEPMEGKITFSIDVEEVE